MKKFGLTGTDKEISVRVLIWKILLNVNNQLFQIIWIMEIDNQKNVKDEVIEDVK